VGYLFETFILNELRAYSSYNQKKLKIYYWGTPSKNEVDFVIDNGIAKIGLELKTSSHWQSRFNKGLSTLLSEKKKSIMLLESSMECAIKSRMICIFLPRKTSLKNYGLAKSLNFVPATR
jgi:predicted AAA+ superfamily ATPase